MPHFIKEVTVIEAHQIPTIDEEPSDEMIEFLHEERTYQEWEDGNDGELLIHTPSGPEVATYGDWITKRSDGWLEKFTPEEFEKSYSPVNLVR